MQAFDAGSPRLAMIRVHNCICRGSLARGFVHEMPFRKPAPELSREALVDTAKALAFASKLSAHIAAEVLMPSDTTWNQKVGSVEDWFTMSEPEKEALTFGCSDSQVAVLNIMIDIVARK